MPRKPRINPELTTAERHRISALDYYHTRKRGIREPECEVCGTAPAECHHIDYNDPERRMWLCKACHSAYHSQFEKPAPVDWMADIRAAMKRIDAERARLRAAREAESSDGSGTSGD